MASSVNFAQNTYSGEVLNDLLTYTAQGNDTYKEGLIHIKSGIQFKYTIPTIQLGKVIQDNVPTPNSTHGAGAGTTGGLNQYTLTERYLEPQEFMVYLEFNPRDYEKYYKFAQPEGNLVFRDLDPKVQAKMLRLLMDRKNEYIGESIWCSAKGGSAAAKITAPEGNMIVDIGGGSTEIAVISLGGIVSNNSIRIAGDDLTADIQEYMSRQHNVKVSERMAERIKIHVGAALTDLGDDAPEDYIVRGPNRITALPMEVPVCYQEVAHCLEKSIAKIETAILSALEQTPPELYADIVLNGIYLAGGGALLRGLDKRLTDKINIPFHIAEDPLLSVAKGTGIALKNVDRFSFLMR